MDGSHDYTRECWHATASECDRISCWFPKEVHLDSASMWWLWVQSVIMSFCERYVAEACKFWQKYPLGAGIPSRH